MASCRNLQQILWCSQIRGTTQYTRTTSLQAGLQQPTHRSMKEDSSFLALLKPNPEAIGLSGAETKCFAPIN